jgi:outer membrane protein TolC
VSIIGYGARAGKAPKDVFSGPAITAFMIPSITWDFWQIPAIRGRVKGAEADRDQALADYEKTVLSALQDANDALSSFASSQRTAAARALAVTADEHAAEIARRRFAGGTATRIDVLNADRTLAQDRDLSVQARSTLMQNYATLQKSLGLGWSAAYPASTADSNRPTARE